MRMDRSIRGPGRRAMQIVCLLRSKFARGFRQGGAVFGSLHVLHAWKRSGRFCRTHNLLHSDSYPVAEIAKGFAVDPLRLEASEDRLQLVRDLVDWDVVFENRIQPVPQRAPSQEYGV